MYRSIVILALILCATIPGHAQDESWSWSFGAYLDTRMGTDSTALDGYDAVERLVSADNPQPVGVYHQAGDDGWTGSTGLYRVDVRAPLSGPPGSSKTWRLHAWNSSPNTSDVLYFLWHSHWDYGLPSNTAFTLTYVRAALGTPDTWTPPSPYRPADYPAVGTTISLNSITSGLWVFPTYYTNNGLDGYVFDFTATVTPEPSSLLALGAGGFGMLGAALTRRRR